MKILGDYTKCLAESQGEELLRLVRQQRRLEAEIAELDPIVLKEKDLRVAIDALLVGAGVQKGEAVLCHGYEVAHNERAGQERLNLEKLVAMLVADGMNADYLEDVIARSKDRGNPSSYATVKPAKGAKVRQ